MQTSNDWRAANSGNFSAIQKNAMDFTPCFALRADAGKPGRFAGMKIVWRRAGYFL